VTKQNRAYPMTRSHARSLCDSWASCCFSDWHFLVAIRYIV